MKIFLIRHVETEANRVGKILGKNDSEVSKQGKVQLKKLSKKLKNEKIDFIISSNLGRAMKTAKAIASEHEIKVKVDKRLQELNWGDFTKYDKKELIGKWIAFYEKNIKTKKAENIRPPHGENHYDHKKRILHFFKDLLKDYKNKTVIIVGHSGTNKVMLGIIMKLNEEETYQLRQDNACINTIILNNKGKVVSIDINDIRHLK